MKVFLTRAKAAENERQYAAAFEFFRLAFQADPTKDSLAFYAARNLLNLGRISEAEVFLNRIRLRNVPKPWLIEMFLGQLRFAQFRVADAERHFRSAWRLNPNSTMPAVLLAECLRKQEKFDEAAGILLKAVEAEGDLDEVYLNLGLIKRAQADYRSAQNYLRKAIRINPNYSEAKQVLDDIESWLSFGNPGQSGLTSDPPGSG